MAREPSPATKAFFGAFEYDDILGKLTKYGTPIRLRGKPLQILLVLVNRPGEVITREELQRTLWGTTTFVDFEQGLNSAVNKLRQTLGDSADQPRYIETIPGQGYRFMAPVHFAVRETDSPAASLHSTWMTAAADQSVERAPETREPPGEVTRAPPASRWWIAVALALATLGGGAWWTWQSRPERLSDGAIPSRNREANDQYELAWNFLSFQSDIPLARKTFERALELDPQFASARLQRVLLTIIGIYNGYANEASILLQAEEDLHKAEQALAASDTLLLHAQTAVYLAQGRLDRIPTAKIEERWRKSGDNGDENPVWLTILRMLKGQTAEPIALLRRTRVL